ncbi:MAG: LON peptidase substrate-binding domain-containing protein [Pseudomonadota bacterium]
MVITERYRKPSDLPSVIPVFPLRGAILLPRATLPLNIFEPRYLQMITDAMSTDRVIGIVQPAGGDEADESPGDHDIGVRSVGCAGRITSYQELDDGRFVITLSGIARFDVKSEKTQDTPYRSMAADYERFAQDFEAGCGEDLVDRENLLRVLKVYLEANRLKADWNSIVRASSEFLINALSVMSPYGSEEKQALLEAYDLKTRADVLVALAEMEIASGSSSGGTLQ